MTRHEALILDADRAREQRLLAECGTVYDLPPVPDGLPRDLVVVQTFPERRGLPRAVAAFLPADERQRAVPHSWRNHVGIGARR